MLTNHIVRIVVLNNIAQVFHFPLRYFSHGLALNMLNDEILQ